VQSDIVLRESPAPRVNRCATQKRTDRAGAPQQMLLSLSSSRRRRRESRRPPADRPRRQHEAEGREQRVEDPDDLLLYRATHTRRRERDGGGCVFSTRLRRRRRRSRDVHHADDGADHATAYSFETDASYSSGGGDLGFMKTTPATMHAMRRSPPTTTTGMMIARFGPLLFFFLLLPPPPPTGFEPQSPMHAHCCCPQSVQSEPHGQIEKSLNSVPSSHQPSAASKHVSTPAVDRPVSGERRTRRYPSSTNALAFLFQTTAELRDASRCFSRAVGSSGGARHDLCSIAAPGLTLEGRLRVRDGAQLRAAVRAVGTYPSIAAAVTSAAVRG